ncbi:MAG: heme-binding protein [Bradyrhizobium sp.]|nr:MAG: heme-binding protein [Bradyrhizobium sp.]
MAVAVGTALAVIPPAKAQQAGGAANSPDVPQIMPFATPYGAPITLAQARAAIDATTGEASRRFWLMNVAVVDSGGNLVAFSRMDGAQLGGIVVAEHKARAAALFRRPTKAFEEAVQKGGPATLSLDGAIASAGGIPLIEDGKLIGAIGCSGGTGAQDETVCAVGAATTGK